MATLSCRHLGFNQRRFKLGACFLFRGSGICNAVGRSPDGGKHYVSWGLTYSGKGWLVFIVTLLVGIQCSGPTHFNRPPYLCAS